MAIPSLAMIPSGYKDGKVYSVLPSNGDGDFTFSRGSSATRVNQDGLIEEITDQDTPRLDYSDGSCPSLLLEPQSTNLYLNSSTMVTQSNTTSASTYTVSFYGTGTITFSGTHTGTLVGTAADERVSATFTATSGTLTSTISGTCEKGQLEQQSYPTSYIPTNGAIATRLADVCSLDVSGLGLSEITEHFSDGTSNVITSIPSTYTVSTNTITKIIAE